MSESNELRSTSGSTPVSVDVRSLPQNELEALAFELLSTVKADGVAIAVSIPASAPNMICTASCGEIAPRAGALLDIDSGISGLCVREKRTLHTGDTGIDRRVDQEACKRLGIQSVAVSPILHGSACIGILEVFSAKLDAFDEAALSRVESEAARAASLIKVEEHIPELALRTPQRGKDRPALFLVSKRLQSSNNALVVEHTAIDEQEQSAIPRFLSTSPALEQSRRLIIFVAAMAATAILGFILIRYMSSGEIAKDSSSPSPVAKEESPARERPTLSPLVSDAVPEVRILMAKAIARDSAAQASLAEHYTAGNGVTRDPVKAAVWYEIAAVNGKKEARRSAIRLMQKLQAFETDQVHFNLGTMFRDGIGTSPDLMAAYSWFSLAQAAGDVRATAALLNLEQVMKPTEVAESRRRAVALSASHQAPAPDESR